MNNNESNLTKGTLITICATNDPNFRPCLHDNNASAVQMVYDASAARIPPNPQVEQVLPSMHGQPAQYKFTYQDPYFHNVDTGKKTSLSEDTIFWQPNCPYGVKFKLISAEWNGAKLRVVKDNIPVVQYPNFFCWTEFSGGKRNIDHMKYLKMRNIRTGENCTIEILNIINRVSSATAPHYVFDIVPGNYTTDSSDKPHAIHTLLHNALELNGVVFDQGVDDDFVIHFSKMELLSMPVKIDIDPEIDKHCVVSFNKADTQESDEFQHDLHIRELEGEVEITYKVREKRPRVDAYQVRQIFAREFKDLEHLKFKTHTNVFDEVVSNCHEVLDSSIFKDICSELCVPNNVQIRHVRIENGGAVIVEEGGYIRDAYVFPGGSLEICNGGKVDHIHELGGAVYGDTDLCNFNSLLLKSGHIDRFLYATLHRGTMMSNVDIHGSLTTSEGSVTESCEVCEDGEMDSYGGYHSDLFVHDRGKLYLSTGSVVHGLQTSEYSEVYIFKGAVIIGGTLNGLIHYEGDNIFEDSNIVVDLHKDSTIEKIETSDILDQKVEDVLKEE